MRINHVLVTGANGFIGQQICRTLVQSGKNVTACIREQVDDQIFAGIRESISICKIPSLDADVEFSHILDDVDVVIHLAGRAHVMHETAANPLREFRRVNVGGTKSLAQAAARSGVKRFIYLSSIKVNGESTDVVPFMADDAPGYSDPYGQSKWEAEERVQEIATGTSMEWVIVRPPLVYGPGVRGNFLALLNSIYRGTPWPVGSLHNRKSLVSVFNLCDFLMSLLNHPAAANNRFLVADQRDVSTQELIRQISVSLCCSPRIVPCHKAILEMAGAAFGRSASAQRLTSSLVVDRQKVKDVLGWSAPTTLEWGLDHTADWFFEVTREKRRNVRKDLLNR